MIDMHPDSNVDFAVKCVVDFGDVDFEGVGPQVLVIDMHPEVGQRQFKLGQWV